MKPEKKVAIFLMMLGVEKGQNIMSMMDNREIKAVIAEISSLRVIAPETQASVWKEFQELGFEENMKPSQVLTVIRFLYGK